METNSYYKNKAIASLKGDWGTATALILIYGSICYVISIVANLAPIGVTGLVIICVCIVAWLLLLQMRWGVSIAFLDVARGKNAEIGYLALGYKEGKRVFLTMLLKAVYLFCWTMAGVIVAFLLMGVLGFLFKSPLLVLPIALLSTIPAIMKSYSYAMTEYVVRDQPELGYGAAIQESVNLMEDHKKELFLLDLSLIGWYLLSCLTLGLGFLFLMPYYETAHAHFYEDLLKEQEELGLQNY